MNSGVQVTKPAHLHDLGHGVERAQRVAGLGEQVERARPGRRVALDHGEVGAEPSGVAVGALPGQVEQVARPHPAAVVACRAPQLREHETALGQPFFGGHGDQTLAGLRPMPEGVHRLVALASGAPVGGI